MRIQLPDVNVLLALLNPLHPHYQIAKNWFDNEGISRWATCPLSENGFIRIHANTIFKSRSDAVEASLYLLEQFKQTHHKTYNSWSDSVFLEDKNFLLSKNH